jgi:hypothetical protein
MSRSGIQGWSIRYGGSHRTDRDWRYSPLIGPWLCLVQGAAIEKHIALLGSHLLVTRRQDVRRNRVSFKLSPRIRFIATALILDDAVVLREFGAVAGRIIVRRLSECRHGGEGDGDREHRSVHSGNSFLELKSRSAAIVAPRPARRGGGRIFLETHGVCVGSALRAGGRREDAGAIRKAISVGRRAPDERCRDAEKNHRVRGGSGAGKAEINAEDAEASEQDRESPRRGAQQRKA